MENSNRFHYKPKQNNNTNTLQPQTNETNTHQSQNKEANDINLYKFIYSPEQKNEDSAIKGHNMKSKCSKNDQFIHSPEQKNEENVKKGHNHEVIDFTTYIELDMHKMPSKMNDTFDWIPIIRDTIYKAVDKKINYVCFIAGLAFHSIIQYKSSLRPIVVLTVKYLGFDCYIDEDNNGVIVCDFTKSTENNEIKKQDDDDDNNSSSSLYDFEKSGIYSLKNKQNAKFVENVVQSFQKQFPNMPLDCSLIICNGKSINESIEYANKFLSKIHLNENKNDNNAVIRQQLVKEMKTVRKLKNEYNLDQEILERVVHEKQNCIEDIHGILDKIVNDIPDDFYIHLTDFIIIYDHIPIETILDIMKEQNYNTVFIAKILNDKSMQSINHALQMMEISDNVKTTRENGLPSFLPSIEIDLRNVGPEKAIQTVLRLMNGLADGPFAEIDLCFNQNDPTKCKPDQVLPALKQKADEKKYDFEQIHSIYKVNGYHFLISNDNVRHITYFNKLIEYNAQS